MMFIGIATLAISCAEPVEPSSSQRVIGTWQVEEVYVQGQVENGDLIERLVIERDGNFILEDGNGVLTVGTWSSDDSSLTLSPAEGEATVLNIVTLTYTKGHFVHNLSSPILGDVEIRYLMENLGEIDY
ncbi:lipocalin family protein [Marivirga sp.]|uniref:lipocalin family protein n=1 Tax=Marivirga sp. TaxID=2018662 RepID=UPI0025CF4C19|nr:lipocalin family protein [Marivirga sp.]